MVKFLPLFALVFLLPTYNLTGQHLHDEKCGFTHILEQREKKLPGFLNAVEQTHQQALQQYAAFAARQFKNDTVYRIPVVVHVVYNPNNPTANLSDELVKEQIRVLNEDFNRTNSDTGNLRAIYQDRAGRLPIEFYLAEIDPNGNPTTGINRVTTTRQSFLVPPFDDLDLVKRSASGGVDAWDTRRYLNIWSCNLSFLGIDALLGFAYPPVGAAFWPEEFFLADPLQGVVINYKVFGPNNPAATGPLSPYTSGRTGTHEVGHFLGLRHIWGDGDCSEDDGLADTPDQNNNSTDCAIERNSCLPAETPDLYENYMDYSTDACQNMFTQQQVDLMLFNLLENRTGLAELRVLGTTDFAIEMYPIPAGDELTLVINTKTKGIGSVKIYNLIGQLVSETILEIDNLTTATISTTQLSAGPYFVQIDFGEFQERKKIMVARS